MAFEHLRPALEMLAIFWGLASRSLTSNYTRFRLYLALLLGYKIATEIYLLIGSRSDPTYFWIYAMGTAAFFIGAFSVADDALAECTLTHRRKIQVATWLCGTIVLLTTVYANPIAWLMSLQAALYAVVGLQTRAAAEVRKASRDLKGSMPYTVSGTLWIVMSLACLTYLTVVRYYPSVGEAMGEWMLAAPMIIGLTILGWSFHTTAGLPVYVTSKGSRYLANSGE